MRPGRIQYLKFYFAYIINETMLRNEFASNDFCRHKRNIQELMFYYCQLINVPSYLYSQQTIIKKIHVLNQMHARMMFRDF